MNFQRVVEEIQVMGSNLVEKVKELIHEGNVQRIIIKNEQGYTLVEIPVTFAAVGVIQKMIARTFRHHTPLIDEMGEMEIGPDESSARGLAPIELESAYL